MKRVKLLVLCCVVMVGLCPSFGFAQTFTWLHSPTDLYGRLDPAQEVTGGAFFTYRIEAHDTDKVREVETGNTAQDFDVTVTFRSTIYSASSFENPIPLIASGSENSPRQWEFRGYAHANATASNRIYVDEYVFDDANDFYRIPPITNGSRDDPATPTLTHAVIVRPSHGYIRGTVKTPQGQGIAGARVEVIAGPEMVGVYTTTDSNGNYEFGAFKAGTYTLRASAAWFQPKDESVTVTAGATATRDFTLQPGM